MSGDPLEGQGSERDARSDDTGKRRIERAKAAMLDHLLELRDDDGATSVVAWASRRRLPAAAKAPRLARLALETLEAMEASRSGDREVAEGLRSIVERAGARGIEAEDAHCAGLWHGLGPRSRIQLAQACGSLATRRSKTRPRPRISHAARLLLEPDALRAGGLRPTTLGRQVAEWAQKNAESGASATAESRPERL